MEVLALIILIQFWIIYKLWNKVNWWEETYHKTKRAHSDIIERYVFKNN